LVLEKRREKERKQRRRAILKAARKLFFKQGNRPVTIADIARKAELSKGAIYLYFSSKEEICAQILLEDIGRVHNEVLPIFDGKSGASEILMSFAHLYMDFFLKDRELFRLLMNFMMHADNLNLSNDTDQRIIQETNKAISVTESIFQYGIDTGEFLLRKEDVRIMRNAFWGMLNGMISLHLFIGKETTREERIHSNVDGCLEVFIRGLKRSDVI
jgi:AcrR family transcriptional regulator